jgi:hypothetical protein
VLQQLLNVDLCVQNEFVKGPDVGLKASTGTVQLIESRSISHEDFLQERENLSLLRA